MLNRQKILSELLAAKGIVNKDNISEAQQDQRHTQEPITAVLEKLGVFLDENINELIRLELGLETIDLGVYTPSEGLRARISPFFANRFRILPLAMEGEVLVVALDQPLNLLSLNYFSEILGTALDVKLISSGRMDQLLEKYYPMSDHVVVSPMTSGEPAETAEEDEAPVIQLVNTIITDAYQKRASDIHIEPMNEKLRIRYRIDGLLREVQSPDKKLQSALLSRVKLMAGMNIAEKRLPQDGRIRTTVDNKEFDLRISTLPAHFGESVVLRILDRRVLTLEDLGFGENQCAAFQNIANLPNGIILVTGPTGSGKSTTLYAVLNSADRSRKKILTVEDPVEYQISGINQVQVKTKVGLSFARVLRSMLRQAPDIIMVGEIRDLETARISVQSALTGHLIFSTLHTNDASSAIARLVDMGIKPYLVAATLRAVLAQRLIRLLCPHCKQAYPAPKDELKILEQEGREITLYQSKGCPRCSFTGYLGRTGIFELLVLDDELRDLIHKHVPSSHLREKARGKGMITLKEHAIEKVLDGITTFKELVRITQSDVD